MAGPRGPAFPLSPFPSARGGRGQDTATAGRARSPEGGAAAKRDQSVRPAGKSDSSTPTSCMFDTIACRTTPRPRL